MSLQHRSSARAERVTTAAPRPWDTLGVQRPGAPSLGKGPQLSPGWRGGPWSKTQHTCWQAGAHAQAAQRPRAEHPAASVHTSKPGALTKTRGLQTSLSPANGNRSQHTSGTRAKVLVAAREHVIPQGSPVTSSGTGRRPEAGLGDGFTGSLQAAPASLGPGGPAGVGGSHPHLTTS